jgi:2-polyprenyl-6-hydroxyphenyl methylase/3-demethylubiquinone-9 3-methyltransferase
MMLALNNAITPVASQGVLFIAIYNDQGMRSRLWKKVKKTYCSSRAGRLLVSGAFLPLFVLQGLAIGLLRHGSPFGYFSSYKKKRGMSAYHDWIDWLGGHPFEVSTPQKIIDFYGSNGFSLGRLVTTDRVGCNQFVFHKQT